VIGSRSGERGTPVAKCAACDSTVVFGEARDGQHRYCNNTCKRRGPLSFALGTVPPRAVAAVGRGRAPRALPAPWRRGTGRRSRVLHRVLDRLDLLRDRATGLLSPLWPACAPRGPRGPRGLRSPGLVGASIRTDHGAGPGRSEPGRARPPTAAGGSFGLAGGRGAPGPGGAARRCRGRRPPAPRAADPDLPQVGHGLGRVASARSRELA